MVSNTSDTQSISITNQTVTHTYNVERRNGNQVAMLTMNLVFDSLDNVADELLEKITKLIQHRLRDSDIVLQLDGYEIILLLKDLHSQDNADIVANELIDIITRPFESTYSSKVHINSGANTRIEVKFSPLL